MKRIIKYIKVCICAGSILQTSCKKDIPPAYMEKAPASFPEVFDLFWSKMNTQYIFWDMDTTDWDAMYTSYRPLFAQLDLNNVNDQKRSVQYFRQMTGGLTDGHYYLSFGNKTLKDSSIYPSFERKLREPDYHNPFPYLGVDSPYFDAGFVTGFDSTTDRNQLLFGVMATINKNILYLHFNRFLLYQSWQSSTNNGVKPVLQQFFYQLRNMPAMKGVIIDLRGNVGGDLRDLNFLIGQLIERPLQYGFSRYKNGNGRLDYTPWIASFINPQGDSKKVAVPVVALADHFSASAAEIMTMVIHSLPNGLFIGEKTWGATGPLTANAVYNAGQFTVGDFLSVQTSSAAFNYLDHRSYEKTGFQPDIHVPFNKQALNRGQDDQLEKAILSIP